MHVVSVQIGSPQVLDLGSRSVSTGIHKQAVDQVTLEEAGITGDAVVNTKHHGGPDQAVYVYSAEDYAWWQQQLGRPLEAGTFGENLTVSNAPETVRIGDRIQVGDALLEVTSPRIPCATFAARMGEAGWIRRFRDANRPGFYCRVLQTGTVRPGDPLQWTDAPEANVSLDEMVEHFYATEVPLPEVRRALSSPIAIRSRAEYEKRLTRLDQ
jgi:MOSC domain-containing protein YiiM